MNRRSLVGRSVLVTQVDEYTESQLFRLFQRHYDNVSLEAFHRDFREKQWVILLEDSSSGEIAGFSTLMLLEAVVEDQPIAAAFSGDTIINRAHWGEQQLVKSWYLLMEELRTRVLPRKLYWFLISKGYRTYLYLPTFFKVFYPRHGESTPPFARRLINSLATLKYGQNFDPMTGLVQFEDLDNYLKPELAQVPHHRLADPNVQFFLTLNPAYARGDELVCIAEFHHRNFKSVGLRLVGASTIRQSDRFL